MLVKTFFLSRTPSSPTTQSHRPLSSMKTITMWRRMKIF